MIATLAKKSHASEWLGMDWVGSVENGGMENIFWILRFEISLRSQIRGACHLLTNIRSTKRVNKIKTQTFFFLSGREAF